MGTTEHSKIRDSPSGELATFIASLTFDDIPDGAVRVVERSFVDTVGVTLLGNATGAGAILVEAMETRPSDDDGARILGADASATVGDAALANGTGGQSYDFDDVSTAMSAHPSVPLVAGILAISDDQDVSGRDAITAYVAGFETGSYLAAPILPSHYEAGWHATSTLGTFSATAASASLLGLDENETRNALNLAASLPAGLKRNIGSMTKPMHSGHAARSGYTAARLAGSGFDAAADAIAGDGGFLDLYAGAAEPDLDARHLLGEEWAILAEGIDMKKYPCCYFAHASIAATEELVRENDVVAGDVASVHIVASSGAIDTLPYDDPETGLEAKNSLPHAVACAVAMDEVGLAAFKDDAVTNPEIRKLRSRVTHEVDESIDYDSHRVTVAIETEDGRTLQSKRDGPPGTAEEPLSKEELRDKFVMCATPSIGADRIDQLYGTLDSLRELGDVATVLDVAAEERPDPSR